MSVRVHVQNFQSIKDADVEIDGFTVVTGTNNTGKTALQRAIRGVFQNTPGTAFIRDGETTCTVQVAFNDHTVMWSKGTGKRDRPTYIIDKGEPLFPGQGVPEEVQALGVMPIQAGGQEVWPTIAPQFVGQVFLLDKPGSVVAEAVSDVERVGQLNRALRAAESDRRQAAATLKVRVADLAKHEADVAHFEGLDDAVAQVAVLEEAHGQLQRMTRAIQGLDTLRTRLNTAKQAVHTLAPVATLEVPSLEEAQTLAQSLAALQKLRQRLKKVQGEVTRYEGVDQLLVAVDETPAQRLLTALGVLKGFRSRLGMAQGRVSTVTADLAAAEADLASVTGEVALLLGEMGQCPMCGSSTRSTP
jgi:DNA repair ATPase RecN